jgi:hypothetical protein
MTCVVLGCAGGTAEVGERDAAGIGWVEVVGTSLVLGSGRVGGRLDFGRMTERSGSDDVADFESE